MEGLSLLMAQLPAAFTVHQPPAGFFLSAEVQDSGGKTRIGQPDSAGGLRGGVDLQVLWLVVPPERGVLT